jgi:hypothetical protein
MALANRRSLVAPAVAVQDGRATAELLPTQDDRVDVLRVELQPNSTIDAAIWSTCAALCVGGLRSYGRRRSIGQSSMRLANATSPALCGASVNGEPHGATGGAT